MCKIIAETKINQKSFIYQKYSDSAVCFDETLNFLKEINVARLVSDDLHLIKNISTLILSQPRFKEFILEHIFANRSEISSHLLDFLKLFSCISKQFIFRPTTQERVKFSSVRNLLIELDFIQLDNLQNSYIINQAYAHLFIDKINSKVVSKDQFKRDQFENEELGFAAERAVIDYEIKRLMDIQINPNEIVHIAQQNISAGYDIQSFEDYLDIESRRIVRYIEVKAVSIIDYSFFWSRNEIDMSRILRESYYLYLLPVKSGKLFELENLKIICDPFMNVYKNINEWHNNVEVISVRKNNK
jgi:hypothetical protein